jgi:hypothetical protein
MIGKTFSPFFLSQKLYPQEAANGIPPLDNWQNEYIY